MEGKGKYGTHGLTDTEVILSPQKPTSLTDEEFRGMTGLGKAYNFARPVQYFENKSTGEIDDQDRAIFEGQFQISGGGAPWDDVISAGYVPNSIILGIIDGLSNNKAKKEAEDDIEKLRGTYPKPEDIMKALLEDADKAVVRPEDLKHGGMLKDTDEIKDIYKIMKEMDERQKYNSSVFATSLGTFASNVYYQMDEFDRKYGGVKSAKTKKKSKII